MHIEEYLMHQIYSYQMRFAVESKGYIETSGELTGRKHDLIGHPGILLKVYQWEPKTTHRTV